MFDNAPVPSLASRFPAVKSRSTCRGFVVYQKRIVWFESHLELMAFLMLAMLPDTATIYEQPVAVTFEDEDGHHRHTFDFLVITHSGRRKFVAVKPAARVVRSRIKHKLGLIAAQRSCGSSASVHLVTDADFTFADRYNATQAFDFCRFPVKEDDAAVARLISETTGAVRIADLVAATGLGSRAFRSIVRLIAYRKVMTVNPRERITYDSFVQQMPAGPSAITTSAR